MVLQRIMEPFFVGSGGRKLTPEQVARERDLATALAGSIGDTSPVDHWTAGMARMVDALGSRLREGRADRAEQEGIEGARDWARSRLASVLAGGGGAGQSTAPAFSGGAIASQPITENPAGLDPSIIAAVDRVDPQGGGMDAYRNAIASIESAGSGDYGAVGPTHPSLGRALGRYQVMEANIGPWSREALGREVTPDEFMASPEIQDAIFDHRFGQYVNQFGPEGAAQAWFAGPGGVGRMDRRDSLGTSVSDYTSRFNNALGGGSGIAEALAAGGAPSTPSGGNSGLVEVLMEGMSNPWVRQQYGGVLEALMGQQIQGMDPMRQAQLEQIMLQNEALRNPPPPEPISVGGVLLDPISYEPLFDSRQTDTPTLREYESYVAQEMAAGRQPMSQFEFDLARRQSGATNINVGDQGQRIGSIPPNYAVVPDPSNPSGFRMEMIPGGPAEQEQQAAAAQAEQRAQQAGRYADVVLDDIGRALDLAGTGTTGMLGSLLQTIPGTNARNLDALLSTIRANIGFDRLQALRDASPTGGALGQVSDFENRLLQATLGNLEQSQTEDQLRRNLERVRETYLDIIHGPGNRPVGDGDGLSNEIGDMDLNGLLNVDITTLDAAGMDAWEKRMRELQGGGNGR